MPAHRRREKIVKSRDLKPRLPEILSSSDAARAIALDLDGEVEVVNGAGTSASGGCGLLVEFEPSERHEVVAVSDARLLLMLTPGQATDTRAR
jgi:hypothetical protein